MMQKITKQPLFEVGQIVATPGALAVSKKPDKPLWSFSRGTSRAIGVNFPWKTGPRTV